MQKQIQIRGISRTPSDRMSADGGCAESLNVRLDEQETAPAVKPAYVQYTAKDERGDNLFPVPEMRVVFIHKGPNFIRSIARYTVSGSTIIGWYDGDAQQVNTLVTLSVGETFVRCLSFGRALCVVTSERNEWFTFKDGTYSAIRTDVPFPQIKVDAGDFAQWPPSGFAPYLFGLSHGWNDRLSPGQSLLREGIVTIREKINEFTSVTRDGYHVLTSPRLAVVALRLVDGTRICSTPTLLWNGTDLIYSLDYLVTTSGYASVTLRYNTYKVHVQMNEAANFFSGYEDIVDGIEVYLSQDLDSFYPLDEAYGYDFDSSTADTLRAKIRLGKRANPFEDVVLQAVNFFLVKSFSLDSASIAALRSGLYLENAYMPDEELVTRQRLPQLSQMDRYRVKFSDAIVYNNKVVANDIRNTVRFPMTQLASEGFDDVLPAEGGFYFYVHVRDDNGNDMTVQMTYGGELYVPTRSAVAHFKYYGMLFFPDARAYAVDVYYQPDLTAQSYYWETLPLSEHPYLPNVSYWYGGAGTLLETFLTRQASALPTGMHAEVTEDLPNRVFASAMDTPWIFPIGSRFSFSGRVIGTAVATAPLSTGQFGQFPLYVFTSDGIWAMQVNEEGMFTFPKPGPRDVCVSRDTITPLDSAVVFVTDRAVMMISGLETVDLSPHMNGRHFTLDTSSEEYAIIDNPDDPENEGWYTLADALIDPTHFMAYARGAKIAYDYTGGRLVLAKPGALYQYVYMLKGSSWHKQAIDIGGDLAPLEDVFSVYPDAYAVAAHKGSHYMYKLSTPVDVTGQGDVAGVIITRAFDLDAPAVRKTIRDIRIRGVFERGHVHYLLLGSFDGIEWTLLKSLRGGSYKMYRMILLTYLSPTERISWIDVDYELRMTNKLR